MLAIAIIQLCKSARPDRLGPERTHDIEVAKEPFTYPPEKLSKAPNKTSIPHITTTSGVTLARHSFCLR